MSVETVDASMPERGRVSRIVVVSTIGGFAIAGVALGLWLGGLAVGLDPAGPDAGQAAMISLIAAVVPVVLGSLLGYMIGRERRRGRTA